MDKTEQHQELIDALKFTPREIEISLLGYGGEIVMGRITQDQYNHWKGNPDWDDYIWDWDYELPKDVNGELSFVSSGCWHECDDIAHECGVEMSASCVIRVTDLLEDRELFETNLDIINVQSNHNIEVEWSWSAERSDYPDQHLFVGQSIEKGNFGSRRIRITRPFDPSLLKIYINEVDGWCLVGNVTYDGEDCEDLGDYDTSGKGSELHMYYEPAEDNDFSDWHDAVTTHPAHDGMYDIEQEQEYTTERRAWWLNGAWRDQNGDVLTAVQRWRGLIKPAA